MDVHINVDAGIDDVIAAHQLDLEVQRRHDVSYHRSWFDEDEGVIFYLFEAPTKAAGESVHHEAYRLVADEILEVWESE